MLRDTYLEIDLDLLKNNIQEIQNFIGPDVILGAVVKANAYGHGAVELAKYLSTIGVNRFLVATLSEALELKAYNVMIMGHTPDRLLEHIVENQIIQTVFTLDQCLKLNELGKKSNQIVKVHLKIETGFNRLGFQIKEDLIETIHDIYHLDFIEIEGAFTHLTLKDETSDMLQINKFLNLMKDLEKIGVHIPIQHILDSIGMVLYPDYHLNMVRVGALIYGLQSEERGVLKVKQILSFKTKISHKKVIQAGESISYGNRWVAKKQTRIATLPFGYADGYPRNMYQKGYVTINQKKYPIIGVICMDQCMIALDEDDYSEEEVIILGRKVNEMTVEEAAHLAETNKNDIVSRFSLRVPRVYVGG